MIFQQVMMYIPVLYLILPFFFLREDMQDAQAAKLRCLIHYFERLSSVWPDVTGRVFYSRQVTLK